MASTHYFICRTSPFLVLGPEKWLSHKELAEGKCPIYVFPDSKTAQTVQSSLPSTVKHGSTIRAQEFIEEALQVRFVSGLGFVHVELPPSGPSYSEPLPKEALMRYSLPAWANKAPDKGTAGTTKPSAEQAAAANQPPSEPQPGATPAMATLLEATTDPGCDTTKGNDSVALSDDLLAVLERYMELKIVLAPSLSPALSSVEKEITDELHFVEFANANAADGYKSFRRLQELRLKRRAIKDTDLVAHILGKLLSSVTPDSLSAAKRDIDGMKNRKYRVRAPETFQHEMKGGTMVI